jgi:hypothetical protein
LQNDLSTPKTTLPRTGPFFPEVTPSDPWVYFLEWQLILLPSEYKIFLAKVEFSRDPYLYWASLPGGGTEGPLAGHQGPSSHPGSVANSASVQLWARSFPLRVSRPHFKIMDFPEMMSIIFLLSKMLWL